VKNETVLTNVRIMTPILNEDRIASIQIWHHVNTSYVARMSIL